MGPRRTINGQTVAEVNGQFNVQIDGASFTLDFADGHSGAFDPVTFTEGSTTSAGGSRSRRTVAAGRDRVVRINGSIVQSTDGRYVARTGQTEAAFQFHDDFAGSFSDVTVSAAADLGEITSTADPLGDRDAAVIQKVLAELLELRTGGRFAVNAGDHGRTLRIAADAAAGLRGRTSARLPTSRSLGGSVFDRFA